MTILVGSELLRQADLRCALGFQVLVKVLKTGRLTRVDESFAGGHIFRVDDHGEEGVDLLLEIGDGWGEVPNEGMVEKYEIGEEVMTDKNTGLGRQGFSEAG